jgi:hypothetical protein
VNRGLLLTMTDTEHLAERRFVASAGNPRHIALAELAWAYAA